MFQVNSGDIRANRNSSIINQGFFIYFVKNLNWNLRGAPFTRNLALPV